MYNVRTPQPTQISHNDSTEGEWLEKRVERIMNNQEPITDGAPQIYSERKDGVIPEYNVRTDRFDLALDAMDKVTSDKIAKREAFQAKLKADNDKLNPPAEPAK